MVITRRRRRRSRRSVAVRVVVENGRNEDICEIAVPRVIARLVCITIVHQRTVTRCGMGPTDARAAHVLYVSLLCAT